MHSGRLGRAVLQDEPGAKRRVRPPDLRRGRGLEPNALRVESSEMNDSGRVAGERYGDSGIFVTYRADPETIARFASKLSK